MGKFYINENFWIYLSFVLAGCIIAVMFSNVITPFLNYLVWGIDTH